MAATTPTTPGPNGLNDEEHRQLLVHHIGALRKQRLVVEDAREPFKAAQEDFTALFNAAKADLGKGYSRKYLTSLLEDATARVRDLAREEQQRAKDRQALGMPVFGIQADLFGDAAARMPDEARDEMHYEMEGYMRGRNGLLEAIPDGTPPRFHQAVMKGYAAGQDATAKDFLAAQELIAKRGQPDAGADPVNLNEDDDEEVVDDKVRKLRRSGFMNTGAQAEGEREVA